MAIDVQNYDYKDIYIIYKLLLSKRMVDEGKINKRALCSTFFITMRALSFTTAKAAIAHMTISLFPPFYPLLYKTAVCSVCVYIATEEGHCRVAKIFGN